MNEWQRQDEDVKQLSMMRQSGQHFNNAMVLGNSSMDESAIDEGAIGADAPDWQLAWKPSASFQEQGDDPEHPEELQVSVIPPLTYTAETTDEEVVLPLYDVDAIFDDSPSKGISSDQQQAADGDRLALPTSQEREKGAVDVPDLKLTQEQLQLIAVDSQEVDGISKRKVFRVGGIGGEDSDSDSDSSSLQAALEKHEMSHVRNRDGKLHEDSIGKNDTENDADGDISSNMSTARAGAPELVSILKNSQGKLTDIGSESAFDNGKDQGNDETKNDHDTKQSRGLGRTSSFAFHGNDRADIRRTRNVRWDDVDEKGGDDDNESITTVNTTGTHEGKPRSGNQSGGAQQQFPHVLTQTEIRAMHPVVLPGSQKAPAVPATSALIEDRKVLSMNLELPPSIDVYDTYTQQNLPEEQRVKLLLPLNRYSRKAVKRRDFEKDRKSALQQLRIDIAKKHQTMYGGLLDYHLNGPALNPYEEVLVTSNAEFRPHRKLDFKESNPFYKLNHHEITCRLLLGCMDKPKLANLKVGITDSLLMSCHRN